MHVAEAIARRRSIRAFRDTPVSPELIERALVAAARAPSGGNLQPWRIDIVAGEPLARLKSAAAAVIAENPRGEPEPAYRVYPKDLSEPYYSRRFKVGEDLYGVLGVAREDKAGRLRWFMRNAEFFGAPMALFCSVDRQMGPPQWSDLGMFLQNLMLLLEAEGLATCAQEYWSAFPQTVASVIGTPPEHMLFCGMAIGYPDPDHPINALETDRAPLSEWAVFHGL